MKKNYHKMPNGTLMKGEHHRGIKVSQKELKIGMKIELEHTKSKRIATKIAKDHLNEFPNYYSKGLIPMEKKLRRRLKK